MADAQHWRSQPSEAHCISMQLDARPVGAVEQFRERDQQGSFETSQRELMLLVQAPIHELGDLAFDEQAAAREAAHEAADRRVSGE